MRSSSLRNPLRENVTPTSSFPHALIVTPDERIKCVFKKSDTSVKTKLVDSKTKLDIVFEVFPKRKFKKLNSWFEGHAQDFLKTMCFEFCHKDQEKMNETDRENASFWLGALNKYVEYRSQKLTIIWLDIEGSIQMQNLRPYLLNVIQHIK